MYLRCVLLLLAVCSVPAAAQQTLEVGLAVSLSGNGAAFGRAELNGAALAAEEINAAGGINGASLQLIVEDTGSSTASAVTALTKLTVSGGLRYIIGPTWLDSYQGVLPAAARSGALLITPSGVAANLRQCGAQHRVFSTDIDAAAQMRFLARRMQRGGRRRFALFFDEDPYSQLLLSTLQSELAASGGEIAFGVVQRFGETDYRAALARLRRETIDAVVIRLLDQAALLAFLKQRALLLPDAPVFGPHDIEGFTRRPEFAGLFDQVWYASPLAGDASFAERYRHRFGAPPALTAANAYDAVRVLAQALQAGAVSSQDAAACLRAQSFASVVFGTFRFDRCGGISGGSYELHAAAR